MWHDLTQRIEKMMSVKYITPEDRWNGDKVLVLCGLRQ
jgi:hypothetical protein